MDSDGLQNESPAWGVGLTGDRDRRMAELDIERRVSESNRDLPFPEW